MTDIAEIVAGVPSKRVTPVIPSSGDVVPWQGVNYEDRMSREPEWAMNESDAFFRNAGKVHETLREITRRLTELSIPHAVVDGMALYRHGFRRSTEDVDLLVTPESLKRIHAELEGRGYLPPFTRSKNLRDTQTGVKIEFLIAGDFPGDGKPKPIAFPDPAVVVEEIDGVPCVRLNTLVELKLASGTTNTERLKDLSDVLELIKVRNLPAEFADQLNPFVREKYLELWRGARPSSKRYLQLWRNKFLSVDAKSLDEMIQKLTNAVDVLKAMKSDGVTLDPDGGTADDYAHLVTADPIVANKYGMNDESEFWGEDGDEDDLDERKELKA